MQLLMIVFVYIHFLIATEGLECWSCNDIVDSEVKCSKPATRNSTVTCDQFCGTFSYNTEHRSLKYVLKDCSGECIAKGCLPPHLEEKCQTSKTLNSSDRLFIFTTVHCCQGDLCNGSVEDSNISVELSDQNVLICVIVLLISLFNILVILIYFVLHKRKMRLNTYNTLINSNSR